MQGHLQLCFEAFLGISVSGVMDEDSSKQLQRLSRRQRKHNSKKSPNHSPDGFVRPYPIEDAERETHTVPNDFARRPAEDELPEAAVPSITNDLRLLESLKINTDSRQEQHLEFERKPPFCGHVLSFYVRCTTLARISMFALLN